MKLFRIQFIYVEVAKTLYLKTLENYKNFSIGCDKCPLWYQISCTGISEGVNLVITGP